MPEFLLRPYRVLDLCDGQGAFCGKLLGDLGADVVKIEPPDGDPSRHQPPFARADAPAETGLDFLAYNTNKRSVTLDLAHPLGRTAFLALCGRADAVIESFAPGHLARLGLDSATLRRANPRLVVASIAPYGRTGPRRHHRSSDLIAMATSGFMQVTGDPDGPPMRLGNQQSRFPPALYAAFGVVAALLHRDWHGGAGQDVDVSMQEALLSFYLEQHPVLCWTVRGKNVIRSGPVSSLAVPAGVFPCLDGWVGIGIFTPPEWDTLAQWLHEATGRDEILAPELRGHIHVRAPHRDLIEAVLLEFLSGRTRADLFREGQRRNLVVVPVNTVADLLDDPALEHGHVWHALDHPVAGRLRYPLNVLGAGVPVAARPAPLLGSANEEILCGELGYSRAQLEELRSVPSPALLAGEGQGEGALGGEVGSRQVATPLATAVPSPPPSPARNAGEGAGGAPYHARGLAGGDGASPPSHATSQPYTPVLDGIRVVEFGPFIALPLTGRFLAALGATVIKVETNTLLDQLVLIPPWGKGMGQPEYQALKRRITLDARTPEGAAVLKNLIAASDVFMTNFRQDALARWGLDLDEMRARDPRLIVVHQSGFGTGPYEAYKLYGIMAQHLCGVSTMSGLPGEPPCCLNSAYSDYHTPLFQALGVLGALDRRRRTGQGAVIEGSILRSGVATVAAELLHAQVSGMLPPRRGNHDAVAVPHDVYPCRGEDEWCAIAVWDEAQWRALCEVLAPAWAAEARFDSAAGRRAHEADLDALIAGATRERDKHELMDALQRAGVPAGIVAKGQDLAADPQLESRGLYGETTYYVTDPRRPGIEWERGPDVLLARLPLLLSETPCLVGPYRRIGEDNDYVYREVLGLSDEEIDALAARRVLV